MLNSNRRFKQMSKLYALSVIHPFVSNRSKQTFQFEVIPDNTSILIAQWERQEPARPFVIRLPIPYTSVSIRIVNFVFPVSPVCHGFNRKINVFVWDRFSDGLLYFIDCWYSSIICNFHRTVRRVVIMDKTVWRTRARHSKNSATIRQRDRSPAWQRILFPLPRQFRHIGALFSGD